jgi:hypothetical protein
VGPLSKDKVEEKEKKNKKWAPQFDGWRRNMKEDGCGNSGYEGENLGDEDGIFYFEGGFEKGV